MSSVEYKNQHSITKEESGAGYWMGHEPSLPQKVTMDNYM